MRKDIKSGLECNANPLEATSRRSGSARLADFNDDGIYSHDRFMTIDKSKIQHNNHLGLWISFRVQKVSQVLSKRGVLEIMKNMVRKNRWIDPFIHSYTIITLASHA